nr:immunoglobulin heavy chain junction region [Mus musculus]
CARSYYSNSSWFAYW